MVYDESSQPGKRAPNREWQELPISYTDDGRTHEQSLLRAAARQLADRPSVANAARRMYRLWRLHVYLARNLVS